MINPQLANEIVGLKSGHQECYTNIYNLSSTHIYRLIFQITKDAEISNAVIYQVYEVIARNINSLANPEYFYEWAGEIATTVTLNHLLSNNAGLNITDDGNADYTNVFVPDNSQMDNQAFIPESILVDNEKQRIISEYVDKLSAVEQIVLQYYYYENQSVQNIANRLQKSDAEVRRIIARVKKGLMEIIGPVDSNAVTMYDMASVPILYLLFQNAVTGIPVATLATSVGVGATGVAAAGVAGTKVAGVGASSVASAGAASAAGTGVAGMATSAGVAGAATGAASVGAGVAATGLAVGAKIAIGACVLAFVGCGAALTHHFVKIDKEKNKEKTEIEQIEDITTEEDTSIAIIDDTTELTTEETTEESYEIGYTAEQIDAVYAYFEQIKEEMYATGNWPDNGEKIECDNINTVSCYFVDADMDGLPELLMTNSDTYMAAMVSKLYGYNPITQELIVEIVIFPYIDIYDNGVIVGYDSHNQTMGEYWPVNYYVYIPETDTYSSVRQSIYGWNKEFGETDWNDNPFPDAVDKDGNGAVYCVTTYDDNWNVITSEWCDDAAKDAAENAYVGGASIIEINTAYD